MPPTLSDSHVLPPSAATTLAAQTPLVLALPQDATQAVDRALADALRAVAAAAPATPCYPPRTCKHLNEKNLKSTHYNTLLGRATKPPHTQTNGEK